MYSQSGNTILEPLLALHDLVLAIRYSRVPHMSPLHARNDDPSPIPDDGLSIGSRHSIPYFALTIPDGRAEDVCGLASGTLRYGFVGMEGVYSCSLGVWATTRKRHGRCGFDEDACCG